MKKPIINIISSLLIICSTLFGQSKSISGLVVDSANGKPLSALILLRGTNFNVLSDSSGEFKIHDLPNGNYQLSCRYVGYNEYLDSISISDSTTEIFKNIKLSEVFYPPKEYKDTVISGYYTGSKYNNGIELCGRKNESWLLIPNNSLRNLHKNMWLQLSDEDKVSINGWPKIFITVKGKMSISGLVISVNNYKVEFIVEKVYEIMLADEGDCNK